MGPYPSETGSLYFIPSPTDTVSVHLLPYRTGQGDNRRKHGTHGERKESHDVFPRLSHDKREQMSCRDRDVSLGQK